MAKASEVKMTVMSFQRSPPGVSPSAVVAARPQSNNESSDFIKEMEATACAAGRKMGSRFLNITVDGVSCESPHVMQILCDFLSCKANHCGSTDPKHHFKSWQGAIISGGGTVGRTMGFYVLDPNH